MAAAATLKTSPVKQQIPASVPAQLTLPSRDGKVTETFQKANTSQFLSHIRIPEKKCITSLQMQNAILTTAGALLIFGAIISYFLICAFVTITPLVLALMIPISIVMISIGTGCLLGNSYPHVESLDLEKPEVFKRVLDDLRTLSLKEICEKYTSRTKDKEFDYLCSKGVIDEATKEIMKIFKNRFEQLKSQYDIAKFALQAQKGLAIQSRASDTTRCAQILERIVRDYQTLEAKFNSYRNTPQKA